MQGGTEKSHFGLGQKGIKCFHGFLIPGWNFAVVLKTRMKKSWDEQISTRDHVRKHQKPNDQTARWYSCKQCLQWRLWFLILVWFPFAGLWQLTLKWFFCFLMHFVLLFSKDFCHLCDIGFSHEIYHGIHQLGNEFFWRIKPFIWSKNPHLALYY